MNNKEKLLYYSTHIGCEVMTPQGLALLTLVDISRKYSLMVTVVSSGNIAVEAPEKCQLLLTPLEKISDEDALEVARIIGGGGHLSEPSRISQIKELFSDTREGFRNHRTIVSGEEWLAACDYLRDKHYMLPFLSYSVKDLIDFGVLKIK